MSPWKVDNRTKRSQTLYTRRGLSRCRESKSLGCIEQVVQRKYRDGCYHHRNTLCTVSKFAACLWNCNTDPQLRRQIVQAFAFDIVKEAIDANPNERPLASAPDDSWQGREERATGPADNMDVESVESSGGRPKAKAKTSTTCQSGTWRDG